MAPRDGSRSFFFAERTGPRNEKNYDVRLEKKEYSTKVTLADMGYGLSSFTRLVLCYYAPEGSTLILEQLEFIFIQKSNPNSRIS